jgi:hypothetical protein
MDPKELRGLVEAYSAVYDEELRDELEEMVDDFAGIEDLTEEEIDQIVEETIDEMLEEGFEFDEVESIFEEVLSEGRIDMGARTARRREYNAQSEKSAKEARSRGAAVVRREKRAEAISKVKGAVKSVLSRAKSKAKEVGQSVVGRARNAVDSRARGYAERRGVVSSKSAKSALTTGTGIKSVAYKQRTPAGRREVRSAVVKDVKGRIGMKVAQAQVGAYGAARRAGQAVSNVAGRTAQSARNAATRTGRGVKGGIKGAIAGAASKVSSGATRLANRMSEEFDVYDVVLEHLLDEGYAETYEAAEKIMVNMSENWIDGILDEAEKEYPYKKVGDKMRQISDKMKSSKSPEEKAKLRKRLGDIGNEYWKPN